MYVCMDGLMDAGVDGCMDVWMYGSSLCVWIHVCMYGWMYGCMDVWINEWLDGCVNACMYVGMDVWMKG